MNITQILLGSTAAILIAALILSYSAMKGGEEEGFRLTSAKVLMDENARLQAEISRLQAGQAYAGSTPALTPPQNMSSQRLAELEEQKRLLKDQLDAEIKKRKLAEEEAEVMTEREAGKLNKDQRRAKRISMATVMAQVEEVAEDQGIFLIVLDVKHKKHVREGGEFAIRRGTGIIGRLVVSRIDIDDNYFADPLPGSFPGGSIDVKVGDELIVAPQ
ncbi:MAG: hypothetical protein P8P36_07590 [Akkermansiaceae bacterium]|nr:hypothetical protein [Akkermansiaceae bacterium]